MSIHINKNDSKFSFCLSRYLDPKSKEHIHTSHANHYFFISKTEEHSWDLLWFDLLIDIYEHVFYFSSHLYFSITGRWTQPARTPSVQEGHSWVTAAEPSR